MTPRSGVTSALEYGLAGTTIDARCNEVGVEPVVGVWHRVADYDNDYDNDNDNDNDYDNDRRRWTQTRH